MSSTVATPAAEKQSSKTRNSYQIINSSSLCSIPSLTLIDVVPLDLLRVFRGGITIKETVDNAVDQCAVVYNLRDSIEESRVQAEQAVDDKQKRAHAQKGTI